tara:strand:+ start:41570 stop:41767 length:198 start_codon:yes stop_codon:yes gene_type:complete
MGKPTILCEMCGSADDVREIAPPYGGTYHQCDECSERNWQSMQEDPGPNASERLELSHRAKRETR